MDFINIAIVGLYFYSPVALANIGANLGKFVPFFKNIKKPIDFGKKINGIRIVGDHKNFGGFIFGVLFGTFWSVIKTVYSDPFMIKYLLLDESNLKLIFLYFIMSIAALCGDLIKSVLKRMLNRPAHSAWIPFDEIDHSLASMLLAKLFFPIPWIIIISTIFLGAILHLVSNVLGYLLKIKSVPY
ncbi:MAG: hypothetical protein AUJ41_03165 [Candidatus Pacebacteria bacterium CG1_02_43_31]|nr:MAG: hypothetical protein AUJ41_03165 [Candidatus Pacebacteria bacterium CG1_02_43_31]